MTYLNLTVDDYESYFSYDRENGNVYLRRSGKLVTAGNNYGLVSAMRVDGRVVKVSVGKMCYFLNTLLPVSKGDKIVYVDGDYTNLKPDNLTLLGYVAPKEDFSRPPVVKVDRSIFYSPTGGYYILRRKPTQAVYRSFDLKEVISVRNEWEMDNSIHKWDSFCGKYGKYL